MRFMPHRVSAGHPVAYAAGDSMTELTYLVPEMSCAHCERAVSAEVSAVPGVASVAVDLEKKRVDVRGEALDDAAIRAAISEAGYEAA